MPARPGGDCVTGGRAPMRERAFTLLELLVATAVALVLSGVLLAITSGTLSSWRRQEGERAASVSAQSALDLLARDISSSLQRRDGGVWLAVDIADSLAALDGHGWRVSAARLRPAGASSIRTPGGDPESRRALAEARFGVGGAWLRLFSANMESDGALPVALAYQIARRPVSGVLSESNPAPDRYALYRSAVTPETTFSIGASFDAPGYRSVSADPPATRSGASIMNPAAADALADDVVDFGILLYAREPDGTLRLSYPSETSGPAFALRLSPGSDDAKNIPVVADVMLRILTAEGATLLADLESGRAIRPAGFATDGDWWWDVVERNSRVFVRRILFRAES